MSKCQDNRGGGRAPAVWQVASKDWSALSAVRLVSILTHRGGTETNKENAIFFFSPAEWVKKYL